ncbi:MAG: hypothetical protein OEM03_03405 [Chromatiales bacterium]|nr:hypothetical protein [Chromatiales bacterium]
MKGTRTIAALLVSLLLGACGAAGCDRPTYYKDSGSTGEIIAPEGVNVPDSRSSLKIPPPSQLGGGKGADNPCLEAAPPYFEESGAIVGSPEALVYAWAEAISLKSIEGLEALYSNFFTPISGDLATWRADKQRQMAELGEARMTVDKLSMAPAPGGRMVAKFTKRIQLGSNITESRIELVLAKDNNAWSIISEKSLDPS